MNELYNCGNCGHKDAGYNGCEKCISDASRPDMPPSQWRPIWKNYEKTCRNCGNLSGDKTDHSKNNPCTTCGVKDSFGIVDFVPEYANVNWIPLKLVGKTENYESDDNMVNHPNHYQSKSGLETIQVIEAFTEDLTGIEAVYTGNVIKYICRWDKKNGLQDLKKAQWYLNHLIEKVEEKENK